jgi:hypothetical protein
MFGEFEIPGTWKRLLRIARSAQKAIIVDIKISECRHFDVVAEMSGRKRFP